MTLYEYYISLDFKEILKVTDNDILVRINDEKDPIWFPMWHVKNAKDFAKGEGPGTLCITEWIAYVKGLEIKS